MKKTGTVLDKILSEKVKEIGHLKQTADLGELKEKASALPKPLDFKKALVRPNTAVIAEIKKASPSAGVIRPDADTASIAAIYKNAGAAALSVLTDNKFFGGNISDLVQAKKTVDIPILRKDFIIDPLQILEARASGADAVLLIVAALEKELLEELFGATLDLGLTPLVEVHNEAELKTALELLPGLIGINNRDLKTLSVSLETCLSLRSLIPKGVVVVAESGIGSSDDIARLKQGGLNAFLIGTSLMKAPDPGAHLRALIGARGD